VIKLKLNDSMLSDLKRDDLISVKGIMRIRNDNLFIQVLEHQLVEVDKDLLEGDISTSQGDLSANKIQKDIIITNRQ